jgi:hypothetical protein
MKQIILSALMLVTIATTAFSKGDDGINKRVFGSFYKSFHNAKEVKWDTHKELVKVSFVLDGQKMFAYYKQDGEQVAITRNLQVNQLPYALGSTLKEKLSNKWLTELFEVSSNGETTYYATLVDVSHVTIFKADASGSWSVFKKEKRDDQ